MKLVSLNKTSLPGWAHFLPEEIFIELMNENRHMYAMGVEFFDEPQGAICWEEKDEEWILRSIYIHPKSRRLGLGSELIAALSEIMQNKDCETLSVSYDPTGERSTLTPFLRRCSFMIEALELPLGVTTLQSALSLLGNHYTQKLPEKVKAFYQLSKREINVINEWMLQELGESTSSYLKQQPSSFVLFREDTLAGMILLSEQQNTISLDYCWIRQDNIVSFLPMLALAAHSLSTHYPLDTRIEIILSTDQAKQLYVHLLGEACEQLTLCKGSFFPLPKEMLTVY